MDKVLHFFICLLLAAALSAFVAPFVNILIVMSVGFSKELYDKYIKKGTFDWVDIWADACGSFLGLLAYAL